MIATQMAKEIKIKEIILFLLLFFMGVGAQENPHGPSVSDCQSCHTVSDWKQITFNHSKTGFPLTGAHSGVSCKECHSLKDFRTAHNNCNSCHTDVHRGEIGLECSRCHTTQTWQQLDVQKSHEQTDFPLIGRHQQLDCLTCHRNGLTQGFLNISPDCYDCHQQDFAKTRNPVHTEQGFPRQCEMCHSMISWTPALFNQHEAFFPIYSGKHSGTWNTCTDCHLQSNNFQSFSCINCHEHERTRTDEKHREVRDYVYESSACYNCHPRGEGED